MKFLKKDETFSQDLSVAALSFTTSLPNKPFKLEQVYFKATVTIVETISITIIDADGTSYDHLVRNVDLPGESSYTFRPQGETNYHAGCQVKVEITDANGVGVVTGKVKTSELR